MKASHCVYPRKKHEWSSNWNLVGGIKENPGVWGIGGAAISIKEACPHCGATRNKIVGDVDHPSRNHGWRVHIAVQGAE